MYEARVPMSLTLYGSFELSDFCSSAEKAIPMRLTLRTLLAYLDDRLSPGNARELGQKIVQSPFATELADRVRSVVRRRRLAADSSDHKSIDANLIAEYLDDQLTPELVALIEKEILGSDHSLAEVAASHQILGLLSDPVDISESLRGRLHKLDPFADSQHEVTAVAETTEAAGWKPLAPQTATSRRSPMLLLLLMVVGWLALLFSDQNLFRNGEPEVTPQQTDEANVNGVPDGDAVATAPSVDEAIVANASPVENPQAPDVLAATRPDTVAATDANQSTSPATETLPPPDTVIAANVPSPTTASSETPVVADTTPNDTSMQPPATDTLPAVPVPETTVEVAPVLNHVFEVRDDNQMHMLRHPDTSVWEWASAVNGETSSDWGKRLSETVSAVPVPFRTQVIGRDSGWLATVDGGSLFRTVSDATSGLEIFEGRAVIQRHGAKVADAPQQITLMTHGQAIMIAIPDAADDRIGVSVTPVPVDVANIGDVSVISVFAADNPVVLTVTGVDQPLTIARGQTWQWNTSAPAPPAPNNTVGQLIPEWVFQTTSPVPDSTRAVLAKAAATFRSETSVNEAAVAMSQDRNPQLAAYGVQLSALIKDVDQLTSYLLQPNEEVVLEEAITGLRSVIQHSNDGQRRVTAILENRLSNMELENAMRMLAGISRTEAEDRFVSSWLVEMLGSNREALRAMAIENLAALTNERNGYTAEGDAGRRTIAIRRWERFLERNDGRLVQPQE